MPVRRRIDRRRLNDLLAWSMYFETGYDYFGNLADAGVVKDLDPIPRQLAEKAWHRLGAAFLGQYAAEQARERYPREEPPYALAEFGPPPKASGGLGRWQG